jgi:hypothetical protein
MVSALRSNQIPVNYLLFEGKQHGLCHGANIERVLEAELYFSGTLAFRTPDVLGRALLPPLCSPLMAAVS